MCSAQTDRPLRSQDLNTGFGGRNDEHRRLRKDWNGESTSRPHGCNGFVNDTDGTGGGASQQDDTVIDATKVKTWD
jgi:hypothetical protein